MNNSTNTKILRKDYAEAYWLKVSLSKSEFNSFVKSIKDAPYGLKVLDGVDEETQEVCFTFAEYVPKGVKEIKIAKDYNFKRRTKFLNILQKSLRGNLYFNINQHQIKRV